MIFGQCAISAFNIISTVVLARLLNPSDFGLIAMVATITGIAALFNDCGLSTATIQKIVVNHEQVSTLFWVNVLLGGFIAIVLIAISPVVAWFYGDPRLTLITIFFSAIFLVSGLTVQHQALLRRQMRFTGLLYIQIISIVVGTSTAVLLAKFGAGYWALVLLQATSTLTIAIGVWLLSGWIPTLTFRIASVKSMLSFGGNITAFNIINYFARNIDNILIGKVWGSASLGLYSKAYGLLMLPLIRLILPFRPLL